MAKSSHFFQFNLSRKRESIDVCNFEHRWRFNSLDFNNAILHLFRYNSFDDQNWLIGWEMKWLTLPWQSSSWSYDSNPSGLLFIEKYRLPLLDNRVTAWMGVFKKRGQVFYLFSGIFFILQWRRERVRKIYWRMTQVILSRLLWIIGGQYFSRYYFFFKKKRFLINSLIVFFLD